MSKYILLLPILLPIVFGALIPFIRLKSEKLRNVLVELVVLLNSGIVFALIAMHTEKAYTVFHLTDNLNISFKIDGMSIIFGGLVSILWPLATLYAFEYMEREERRPSFFAFYTMTFGVTLGVAFSANLMTLYIFYELLTLITVPLVMHKMDAVSRDAARKYMVYSITGAAFAFIGFIFILTYGSSIDFTLGGVISQTAMSEHRNILLLGYVFAFMGFGVKAAVVPLCGWLPKASVAPTPVTALLHAVAVVKSGAFAIIRVTFYSYGADNIRGTVVQYIVMAVALCTILYGSSMAVKETHIKRRLAYSTISNLSYVLFGVTLMTPLGMGAALSHLIIHAFMKIVLFFGAGAIMEYSEQEYIPRLVGIGKKMPFTMTCFAISSLAVIGIPPFAGFISKWRLMTSAVETENILAYIGAGVLIISAVLTAIYLLTFVVRGFWPERGYNEEDVKVAKDPGWRMKLPLLILTVAVLALGLCFNPIAELISDTVYGLL